MKWIPYLLAAMLGLLTTPLGATPLKIVSEPWPPYVFLENGAPCGADLEVSDHLLRELGYQPQWRMMPWKRAQYEVLNGSADAILDIAITPERLQQYHFPDEPLSLSETVLFYHNTHPHPFNSLEDLRGLRIGVSAGYSYSNPEFMQADFFSRKLAPSIEANLLMLQHGRVDLAVVNRRAGLYTLHNLNLDEQISYNPKPLSSGNVYLAFQRQPAMAQLAERFSSALRQFKQTAEYRSLLARYGLN
ncbi:ABC transporter substrate-binding protein [Halopseudomonas oceani]|uniref:Amino acid ABC transporter substrate-binding protein n=1 Tax=Halopseudomonas oceani TaxID=1708783 RepID=A0A2P4ETN8_9GAMM|nr:transporter substrate-binding domain-containing protein [Halopseudomonas oceani]POB02660.1 amino acid ABC transporter substrate-binding protein [Halopseudomonas oceani]GGE51183.1 ABC transporter substrate-binding protein [Halopseudomonas oceani]